MISNLQDIPCFRRIKSRRTITVDDYLQLFIVVLMALVVALYVLLRDNPKTFPIHRIPFAAFVVIAFVAAWRIWVLCRESFFYSWNVDDHEICAKGIFRNICISWDTVTDAKIRKVSYILGKRCVIQSGNKVMMVPIVDPLLMASVYLHLQAYGKESNLELPEDALACLLPIPDESNGLVIWDNPKPPKLWKSLLSIAFWVVLTFFWIIRYQHHHDLEALIFWTFYSMYFLIREIWRTFKADTPRHLIISDSHLEVTALTYSTVVPLNKIKSIQWRDFNANLIIRLPCARTVILPWDTSDSKSNAVIAALLIRLRNVDTIQPPAIPADLIGALRAR